MEAWNKRNSEIKKNCFLSNYVLVDKIFNKFSPINWANLYGTNG